MAYAIPYNSQLDAFSIYHKISENAAVTKPENTPGPGLPALGHALAGSIGSAISNVIVYPLDLVVKRLQVQNQQSNLEKSGSKEDEVTPDRSILVVLRRAYEDGGGVRALYAGLGEDTAKTILDSFLFFLLYHFLRQTRIRSLAGEGSKRLNVREELGVGMLAGALSKLVTTPIANVVTRKQTAKQTVGTHQLVNEIYEQKGLSGFWSGYSATLVLTLNPSLTFFFYEFLKRLSLRRDRRTKPSALAAFLLGAISKALASTITYPFSLAKTRAQLAAKSTSQGFHRSLFMGLLETARLSGPGALYQGLDGEVVKGFLSNGITMMTKEKIHRLIIVLYLRLAVKAAG